MAKSYDELRNRVMSPASRARADARAKAIMQEMLLSEIRELVGMSQAQLAGSLGVKQPSLSKLESQQDMRVSTLSRVVEALGGRLRVIADLPTGSMEIRPFSSCSTRQSNQETQGELSPPEGTRVRRFWF